MTTERLPHRPAPRLNLSALEWKLYLVAALGLAYTTTWVTLERPTSASDGQAPAAPLAEVDGTSVLPAPTRAPIDATAQASPGPAQYVWLHELPPGEQPTLHIPAGWVVASQTDAQPADGVLGRAPRDPAAQRADSLGSNPPSASVPSSPPPARPRTPAGPPPASPSLPPPPAPVAGTLGASRQAIAAAPPPPPTQAAPPPPRSAPRTARARIMTRSS